MPTWSAVWRGAWATDRSAAIREEIPEAEIAFNLASIGSGWMHVLKVEGIGTFVDIFGYHSYNTVTEYGVREEVEMAKTLFRRPSGCPVRVMADRARSGDGAEPPVLPAERICPSEVRSPARPLRPQGGRGGDEHLHRYGDFLKYYEDGRDQYFGLINAREDRPKLGFATFQNLGWFCDGLSCAPDQFVGFIRTDRSVFGELVK